MPEGVGGCFYNIINILLTNIKYYNVIYRKNLILLSNAG